MRIANSLVKLCGGGTAIAAPITKLMEQRREVDVFIGITDSIDWYYGVETRDLCMGMRPEVEGPFIKVWRKYKDRVAPNAKAFLITVAPYGYSVSPPDEKDVSIIYGWSPDVLRFIAHRSAGVGQLDAVKATKLE